MPQATLVKDCGYPIIDHTPGSDVALGDVLVIVDMIAVAHRAIASGVKGSLMTGGVFNFTKAAGGSTAIPMGTIVYWDDTNNVATSTASTHKKLGLASKASVDADVLQEVLMRPN